MYIYRTNFATALHSAGVIRMTETEGAFDQYVDNIDNVLLFAFHARDDNLIVFATKSKCTLYVD